MKKVKCFLFVLLVLPFAMLFSACSSKPYITSIEKTKTIGKTDTYTVTYSDGTQSFLTVENGEDGQDATLTLDIIKQYCEENGLSVDEYIEQHLIKQISSQQDATNKVLNSSVGIWSEIHSYSSTYDKKQTSLFCGSGVIFKMDSTYSYVVTNYHVVYNSNSVESNKIASSIHLFQYGTSETVYAPESKTSTSSYPEYIYPDDAVECTYIGGTMKYDIAIVRVRTADLLANNPNTKAATFASDYKIGQELIAVGNPEGSGLRANYGYIAKESEYTTLTLADDKTKDSFRVIGIDVAVNGGNSGGGVYNLDGEVVGIVNAKLMYDSNSNPTENISYALPAGNVEKVLESILNDYEPITNKNAKAKKLYMGIKFKTSNYASVQDETTGIITLSDQMVIEEVTDNSLGKEKGFQVGDIITEITIQHLGEQAKTYKVSHAYELCDLMFLVRVGDSVMFKYTRNGLENTVTIPLITSSHLVDADTV